ncbi:DNA polymerase III subunit beta [Candidatus Karelsulcia muelleri]|uniref:DNA polymerase III subunit beta n=1 Tax=Candidatus Karelsulcia muelleri TaxID=336810 RepID=UPI0009BFADC8|nr:DNA polymerase III subunit beta [Candidatus Karelsulcia muelleri]MBU6942366.1 DNA polymerase III subunit beta [Candidatus Karelsulcia muelleri]
MKFITSSNDLLKELKALFNVINLNNKLPILETFYLKIKKKNILNITVSDLEITMTTKLRINSINYGSAAIPYKILIDILKNIPEQPLTFIKEIDNKLKIIYQNGEYNISIYSSEEYPKYSILENTNYILISEKKLLNIINNTLFAVGNDDIRPVINGVLFEINSKMSNFVSTNTTILVKYTRKDILSNNKIKFIISKKTLNILKNNLENSDEYVYISYNKLNTSFLFKKKKIICSLINGIYPNYLSIINNFYNKILIINRNYFINSIKRVTYFSKIITQIILNLSKNQSKISSWDYNNKAKAFEYLFCSYEGDPIKIGFNSKFLIDILSNINCDDIKFEILDNKSSCKFTPDLSNIEEILILIMPIKDKD